MKDHKHIFGIHPVLEALKSAENIDKVLMLREIKPEIRREILQLASKASIPVQFVPAEKFRRMMPSGNHQGVIAVVSPVIFSEIEPLVPWWYENGVVPLVIVMDEITDVRNFGAITRTAECAGVHAMLVPFRNSAQINAQTVKTSAGALYNIPLCRTKNMKTTLQFLKQSGFQIVACSEKGEEMYTQTDFRNPLAIVLGNEEYGISDDILKISDQIVRIPVFGTIESLNVSVAAGVILYEVVRQRND